MTHKGTLVDLIRHLNLVGCPECGAKENFKSTVTNRIVEPSTLVQTIDEMGKENWEIICGNPDCNYKITKLEEIFRDKDFSYCSIEQ